MPELRTIGSYLNHLVTARTRYSVHSPFVFSLINDVLRPDPGPTDGMRRIESLRIELFRSKERIRVTDLGAGSQRLHGTTRSVADIAHSALKSPKQARMLHRLAQYMNAHTILELGTSLGITSLYLAHAAPESSIVTIEGCPQTQRIAANNFHRLRTTNITSHLGSFEQILPQALTGMDHVDMAFLDGDHRRGATIKMFKQCAKKAHEGSVFILDDIHWSTGMEQAWETIIRDERVTVSIDTFHMGLVFFRKGQHKEHFKLRV